MGDSGIKRKLDNQSPPAALQDAAALPAKKQALSRKEIPAEDGWSERSTARLEQRKLLQPVVVFRHRLYLREDIEQLLRNNKSFLAAKTPTREVRHV